VTSPTQNGTQPVAARRHRSLRWELQFTIAPISPEAGAYLMRMLAEVKGSR
jgi:hypothetical protein